MSVPREGSRNTSEGIIVSIVPDVCLTPMGSTMVPVPYTIWAKQSDEASTTPTVRFTGQRTHNMGSLITKCYGDEAGTGGGVKSGTHNGLVEPMEHSSTVRSEGKPVIRHNDIWWMNNKNTQGKLMWVKAPDDSAVTPQSKQGWEVGAQYAQAQPSTLTDAAPASPGGSVIGGPWPGSGVEPGAMRRDALRRLRGLLDIGALGLEGGDMAGRYYVGTENVMGRSISQYLTKDIPPFSPTGSEIGNYAGFPSIGRDAHLTYANDLLSLKSGDVVDFRTMDPDKLEKLIKSPWPSPDVLHQNAAHLRDKKATQKAIPAGRTAGTVNVSGTTKKACDEICEVACQCKQDPGGARTFTDCVARELRNNYYDKDDKNGKKYPDGSPRRPKSPTADGPRPEVSYRRDAKGIYGPVESTNDLGMPSSQIPIKGAPRPDISWWKNGKLWKIFELKFGEDGSTDMQERGEYEKITRDQTLDPDNDLIKLNVDDDCDCRDKVGKASAAGQEKCKD